MAGDDRLGRLDVVDDGAEVAGGLRRVVGRDHRGLVVDDVDAVVVHEGDVGRAVAGEVADGETSGASAGARRKGEPKPANCPWISTRPGRMTNDGSLRSLEIEPPFATTRSG